MKEVRSNERFKAISIVIYSTSASENDINETFLNDADIYIKKPNNFDIPKQVLEKAVTTVNLYQDTSLNRENFLLKL